jgi:PAS domain S-box-containing protein
VGAVLSRPRGDDPFGRPDPAVLAAAVDVLDGLVVVLNCRGRVRWFNRACERATGYRAAEVLGRFVWDVLIPPAEVEEVKAVFSTLVQGISGRHENHWLTRDGGSRLIRWSNCVVRDARGGCRYVVGTGVDVTDQRHAEQARRESEALFRSVFEHAAVGIAQVGLDGRWLRFNDALCRIVGYSRQALSGMTFQDITHPDDLGADLEQKRRLEAGEIDSYEMEKRYLRPEGSTVWAHLTGSVVRGPMGDPVYFVAIVKDASTEVEARKSLLDSEARTRGIVETAAEAIVTIEETGLIESVNPAAGRMFGYTPEELIGRDVGFLMTEPHRGRHDSYLRRYLRTGEGRVIGVGREVVGRRKDGTTVPCDLSVGEVRLRDRRLFTGVLRDATDRKCAEELRVAKEAADAANRAKDEVLAAVAHDLRTPLGAIGLWLRLLQLPDQPDVERVQAIEAIEDAVRLQHRLIEDLLDASRIANGTLRVEARPVDLAAVAREAVGTMRGTAGAGGVELEVEGCDAAIPVLGDPVRLQQALWNLLSNAVKFTPPGGRVRLALRPGGGTVEVCVSDTGCGIDVESLRHVFDRYWQGHRAGTGSGLGLGLAIVRHIVELHGGTVRAESEGPGKGATFAFTLPLAAT